MLVRLVCTVFVLCLFALAGTALPATISDASFFTAIPHTLITFDVTGMGVPLNIGQGGVQPMPTTEYAAQGIEFSPAINWVNDNGSDFDAAQAIGGSLPIAIPSAVKDDFVITFSVPTHAFGLWVVNNNTSVSPIFTARDVNGSTIESATFQGPLVDGTIGRADYGFMGIVSDTEIKSVRITKDATIFDDLRLSPLPEPFSLALMAPGGLLIARRRRA